MQNKSKLPTYFISHGGGPWPWLKKEMPFYDRLESSLQNIPKEIGVTPKAILVISGHWETSEFAVMAHPQPPMVYDYYGFPEHTYHIQYRSSGAPEIAKRVQALLKDSGIPVHLDSERGYDHGTFTPLAAMYPEANVPVLQLSIRSDYDPRAHIKVGQALAPLRQEGILIVASGLSYHNLRNFGPRAKDTSHTFDQWLTHTVVDLDPKSRIENLLKWEQAPAARLAHPQEDHLIPLMVAVGAAENEKAEIAYHEDDFMGGIAVTSFRFGKLN